jgi:hypothetical protein
MFKMLHLLLQQGNHYGISEEIDILKGINKLPKNIKQASQIALRKIMSTNDKKDSRD